MGNTFTALQFTEVCTDLPMEFIKQLWGQFNPKAVVYNIRQWQMTHTAYLDKLF